jgi:hypothetical protein
LEAEMTRDDNEMRARLEKRLTRMREASIEELQMDIDARSAKRSARARMAVIDSAVLPTTAKEPPVAEISAPRVLAPAPPAAPVVRRRNVGKAVSPAQPSDGDQVYLTLLGMPQAAIRGALADSTTGETLAILRACTSESRAFLLESIDDPIRSLLVSRLQDDSSDKRAPADADAPTLRRFLAALEMQVYGDAG